MRKTTLPAIAALLLCTTASIEARADASDKIGEKASEAMENFDLLEFDEAKKLLTAALKIAKKNKLRDQQVADVHVKLGIVFFSGFEDEDSAKLHFIEAVNIKRNVELDPSYSTKPMAKLLAGVRTQYGGKASGGGTPESSSVDCDAVEGLTHTLIDEAPAGAPVAVSASVGAGLKAASVVVHYRPKGATDFASAKLKRSSDCEFKGEIPAAALTGDVVHYYIDAVSRRGKKVDSKGSSGSPNIIEVSASNVGVGFGETDEENPLGGSSSSDVANETSSDVGKKVGPIGGAKKPRLFLSLSVGSGGGYVSGSTEQVNSPVGCCFAPALLHLFPELGYYLNEKLAVAVAFRMGFPIGANRRGHASAAPAGLLRAHYALAEDGNGLAVSGAVGVGLIRHTIKVDMLPSDMDTDTTVSGPLLVGAGVNYQLSLSGPMRFIAELNALSALGGMKFAGVKPGFALQVDANVGIRFAF